MKKIIAILLISSFLLFQCKRSKERSPQLISAHQMKELLERDSVQLIDVRTAEEFYKGHIENAQNIDFFSADFDLKMAPSFHREVVQLRRRPKSPRASGKVSL